MKQYLGVKMIKGQPMNRLDYNVYRNWDLPDDENGSDAGFLVEYLDGGQSNHPNHNGYISWSPADVFANAYRETVGMTFGLAIEALKLGDKVARTGWNGKDMWLAIQDNCVEMDQSYIFIRSASGDYVPWLASQSDVLSEDWEIV